MYLLHTTDFRLKLYLDDAKRPPYAILSHTWLRDGDEVSFEGLAQYHSAKADEKAQEADTIWSLPGFCKIRGSCEIAKQHGMEWIWIDTCCIDKRSSAELSEAINSMFKWYKESAMCIVFLEDVRGTVISEDLLRDSRWFTRGWTLQELLAPQKQLLFFDCEWQLIADLRKNNELCRVISHMTRIPAAYLNGAPLSEVCVAKKMSWAANRETTRIEDRAYSLLGIFDVNMALLYGEGEKAFIRLQEEILNQTHDHSILAWGRMIDWRKDHHDVRDPTRVGVFAASPQEFEDCWDFEIAPEYLHKNANPMFQMTSAGVQLGTRIAKDYSGSYRCQLACFSWREPRECLCIRVSAGPRATTELSTAAVTALSPWLPILPQYVRTETVVTRGCPPSVRKRSATITLAKQPEQPKDDTGVLLLDLPQGFAPEQVYTKPNFKVQADTHRLGQRSFRISYQPEADNIISLPISSRVIMWLLIAEAAGLGGAGIYLAVRLLRENWQTSNSAVYFTTFVIVLGGLLFTVGLSFALLWALFRVFEAYIINSAWVLHRRLKAAFSKVQNGQLSSIRYLWRSTADRETTQVCFRIKESGETLGPGEDGMGLIIVYSPRVYGMIRSKEYVLLRPAVLRCFLIAIPPKARDPESVNWTNLGRWLSVLQHWPTKGGLQLRVDSRVLSSTRDETKAPSLSFAVVAQQSNLERLRVFFQSPQGDPRRYTALDPVAAVPNLLPFARD